jgi:hypothetical protein
MEVPPEDHRWPEFQSGGRSPLVPIQRVLLLLPEGGVETECALGPHGFGWAGSTRCTLFLAAGGLFSPTTSRRPSVRIFFAAGALCPFPRREDGPYPVRPAQFPSGLDRPLPVVILALAPF